MRNDMATTLLLDRSTWDLVLDASGNIALASEPYSQTQDAASAARVFEGEVWYDNSLGLPYFSQILGKIQPLQVFRAKAIEAAETVPGVQSADVIITAYSQREIKGQIQIRTANGVQGASF